MADDPIPAPMTSETEETVPPPPRRKVYQPTLFQERRRRRLSPWIVVPLLLAVLVGMLYYVYAASHRVRFVPTAGEIVYASDDGSPGTPHLWVCRFDGSGAHRQMAGSALQAQPAFSPGGSQVAFVSGRAGQANQVFVVDGDGKNMVEVTNSAEAKTGPSWSPGNPGTLGYLAGGVLYSIPVVGEGGGEDRILPPPPNTRQAQASDEMLSQQPVVTVPAYAWSPAKGGGLAAVEDTGDIQALAVMSSLLATPVDMRQTAAGNVPLLAADTLSLGWNADGTMLAVGVLGIKGLPAGSAGSAIMLFEPDGTQVTGRPPITVQSASVGPQNPVFSPDGTQIVFELWSEPNLASLRRLGLYIVPTDGSAPPRLLFKGDAEQARFAPDGSAVFFLAARRDGHDLCRIAPDGSGFQRLSDGQGDVSGFSVSPQQASSH